MNLKQNFVKNCTKTTHRFISLLLLFWLVWFIPSLFPTIFFFFWSISKKKHTGKFSSIRPFIQKVAQHIRSIRDPRLKTGWKRIHLCRRVLNEPLHYSIRSTLCNEINESKNKRNNISPAETTKPVEMTDRVFFTIIGKNVSFFLSFWQKLTPRSRLFHTFSRDYYFNYHHLYVK